MQKLQTRFALTRVRRSRRDCTGCKTDDFRLTTAESVLTARAKSTKAGTQSPIAFSSFVNQSVGTVQSWELEQNAKMAYPTLSQAATTQRFILKIGRRGRHF